MPDRFAHYAASLVSPASTGFAITPNDGADLPEITRALYIGGSGNVAVVLASGGELVFVGLAGGTVLPVRVSRVRTTGTTATALLGLL